MKTKEFLPASDVLRHFDGCPENERVETFATEGPGRVPYTTTRCLDCGAQVVSEGTHNEVAATAA